MRCVSFIGLLALAAHAESRSEQGFDAAQEVVIRKVGYPEEIVKERAACGERRVKKSVLNPDYMMSIVFGGFREGRCADLGYSHFEEAVVRQKRLLPFLHATTVSFDVYSRDPTFIDVAKCLGRECGEEMSAIKASGYTKDVAHCISPAFGPCAPKAWACLGDDVCKSALSCVPKVARECEAPVWKMVTDAKERAKLECIATCKGNVPCVVAKCGKDALECLTNIDKECHQALTCVPDKMKECSKPAFDCIFKDGACRDNLKCLAHGANVCADPAVNMLTDTKLADLNTCANQKCPAPGGNHTPHEAVEASALELVAPKHYPEQLACMTLKCGSKVIGLFGDKDVRALTQCFPEAMNDCGNTIWDCLGDDKCYQQIKCWVDGLHEEENDVWKMVTDPKERQFDEGVAEAVHACVSDCDKNHKSKIGRAFCVAGRCGAKTLSCLKDGTCRHALDDIPLAALKCGIPTVQAFEHNKNFRNAAKCVAEIANTCGKAGIELVRDLKLADIVKCNAQCTRPPTSPDSIVV